MSYDFIPNTRISLIRDHGYYFFCSSFCAATNLRWILFEGGVYFFRTPVDTNDSYVQVIELDLLRIGAICAAGQTLNASGVNHNVTTDK